MKKMLAIIGAVAVMITAANASYVGDYYTGPGNSWLVSWSDGNNPAYDRVEAYITSGNAVFDAAFSVSGMTGHNSSGTFSYADGATIAAGANTTDTLSFAGSAPSGGVVVQFFYYNQGNLLNGISWEWDNLPQGSWRMLPANQGPPNIPDAGATMSLLGIAVIGLGAIRRKIS